ncbi:MAG TPA: DHA2 family efflux MFS transporter permease subunit [Streptosporangiaceae bacterium]|jgi:EmrB/QacA subfamily drug resistance transporter
MAKERLDPGLLKLAGILVLGAMAPLLDSTIVNVAIRTLGHDLRVPVASVQWVSTGYLLALAIAVPVAGWTAERYGARRMWLAALGLFLAGSVLSGLAWNIGALVAFRAVQGFGGGLMLPILQTVLMRAAGGRGLGRLMAVVTLPALVAPIFGPVVGGLIVGHLSWRWIFYVNVPVCLAAIALAWRALPADRPGSRPRLDATGLALLSPGVAALVYGLSRVGDLGGFGHVQVLAPLVGGALLVAAFAVHAVRDAEPLIDLRLFADRGFAAATASLALSGLAMFSSMLLLPLYYQQVRGASVIMAGLLLVPQGVGSLLARGAGALTDRIGPRPVLLAAIAATVAGTVPFAMADRAGGGLLAAALVVRGLGLSAANMAVMVGAFQGLDRARLPHASGITRIAQQLGGSFGTAILAVVLQRQLTAHPSAPATAYAHTFALSVALTVLAVVPALLMPAGFRTGKSTAAKTETRA